MTISINSLKLVSACYCISREKPRIENPQRNWAKRFFWTPTESGISKASHAQLATKHFIRETIYHTFAPIRFVCFLRKNVHFFSPLPQYRLSFDLENSNVDCQFKLIRTVDCCSFSTLRGLEQ